MQSSHKSSSVSENFQWQEQKNRAYQVSALRQNQSDKAHYKTKLSASDPNKLYSEYPARFCTYMKNRKRSKIIAETSLAQIKTSKFSLKCILFTAFLQKRMSRAEPVQVMLHASHSDRSHVALQNGVSPSPLFGSGRSSTRAC